MSSYDETQHLVERWAGRASAAIAGVDRVLEKAGLDREAIFAQVLADKAGCVGERIDSLIFRAEQR
jgi:hypothetical protein